MCTFYLFSFSFSFDTCTQEEELRSPCDPLTLVFFSFFFFFFFLSFFRLLLLSVDIDLGCTVDARCDDDGMLMVEMPFWQRYWAHGYIVPFPVWTVFAFPGLNTHAYDYNLFFNNLRKNGIERVKNWEKINPKSMKKEVESSSSSGSGSGSGSGGSSGGSERRQKELEVEMKVSEVVESIEMEVSADGTNDWIEDEDGWVD